MVSSRYLLLHNCFERLSMYFLGCLVDYQAAVKALPFCYALIRLAIATNHGGLNHFILNEMLPTIMLLIDGDLPSAISKHSLTLNSATKEDARNNVIHLCQEIYEVYIYNQVSCRVYSFCSVFVIFMISKAMNTCSN